MAVDSYAATSLAKAMGHSIMDTLAHYHEGSSTGDSLDPQFVSTSTLGLASDIQAILGDAMVEATSIFPHKPPATPSRGTLPQHLWPKLVRHDISKIRRRAKAIRRLIKYEAGTLADAHEKPQGIPRYPSGPASIRRYLCARSLARRPKTWTPSDS